jgi:hypothetical protein
LRFKEVGVFVQLFTTLRGTQTLAFGIAVLFLARGCLELIKRIVLLPYQSSST